MMPSIDSQIAIIGIAEKGFVNVRLVVEQTGGHSSSPPENTGPGILALAIVKLEAIRETRKPGSRYASLKQCHKEVDKAEVLLRMEGIPVLQTTHRSIEEISSRVLMELGLQKEMF
jgi:regulator of PEP synthase PpsR (kinase-PPPase family)